MECQHEVNTNVPKERLIGQNNDASECQHEMNANVPKERVIGQKHEVNAEILQQQESLPMCSTSNDDKMPLNDTTDMVAAPTFNNNIKKRCSRCSTDEDENADNTWPKRQKKVQHNCTDYPTKAFQQQESSKNSRDITTASTYNDNTIKRCSTDEDENADNTRPKRQKKVQHNYTDYPTNTFQQQESSKNSEDITTTSTYNDNTIKRCLNDTAKGLQPQGSLHICLSSKDDNMNITSEDSKCDHTTNMTAASTYNNNTKKRCLNEKGKNVPNDDEQVHASKGNNINITPEDSKCDHTMNMTTASTYNINTGKRCLNDKGKNVCFTTSGDTSAIKQKKHSTKQRPDDDEQVHASKGNNPGVSDLYMNLGDCNYACEYCNTSFWYGERLKTNCHRNAVKYSKCCSGGQVYLEKELEPPQILKQIFKDKHFLANIRAYNQMFSMTSFGAQIDDSINNGKGPYVFKISGQIHHWIGTICTTNKNDPKFMQLYIYDTDKEVTNRLKAFGGVERTNLQPEIVQKLIQILDDHNELVKVFRTARDKLQEGNIPELKIQLYNVVGAREYQLPSSNTLGAIVFEPDANSKKDYDIIIEYKDRQPQRISKLHSSYMSLQFPLLFIYGQPGYNTEMTLKGVNAKDKRKKMSMNMYYKYQLHERRDEFGILFRAGKLFQQYIVTAYCAIEQIRLDFVRAKQNNLRSDCLAGICDAMSRGDHFGSDIGQKIILPSSFTGGPRYMYSHYLDALAICRVLGNPQYFITFTCNVNWPEIRQHMKNHPDLSPSDRADVIVRVFQQKVEDFLAVLKEQQLFGHSTGVLYTIEFQKRGLPHCHTLLWLDMNTRIKSPEEVDRFISAEIPDKTTDPAAYRVVADMMMHGPCGNANPKAACMQEGMCTKKYPKRYNDNTYFDENGHIHYKRRRTSSYVPRGELKLDNTNVVPYNRQLCLMFHAHINVEYCGWSMLIKYLFKYISKGTDRIAARIIKPLGDTGASSSTLQIQIDEVQNFIDGRFLCPHESCWRILDFPIHHREPAVQILAVHLKDMQKITFRDKEPLAHIVTDEGRKLTTLTEWFTYNALFEDGLHLTYLDFPSKYVWYEDRKIWKRRVIKTKYSIGRLVYVHPAAGELFYFRMLLGHQKGCRSYVEVRTVNNKIFPTYRAACEAMGLLEDDNEWDTALQEASMSASSQELRTLFANILMHCEVSNPLHLWERHWDSMKDDITPRVSQTSGVRNLYINDEDLKNHILYQIEMILNNSSRSIKEFGFSLPPKDLFQDLENRLLMEEKNYNRNQLKEKVAASVVKLNAEQQEVYNVIVNACTSKEQKLVFVYGHGGTGKTFLWKTIINKLRSEAKIVLAVASSGIASLLLPSGRTSHSRFKIPLELTDESMCQIKKKHNPSKVS